MKILISALLATIALSSVAQAQINRDTIIKWTVVTTDETYNDSAVFDACAGYVCKLSEAAGSPAPCRIIRGAGVIGVQLKYADAAKLTQLSCVLEVHQEEVLSESPLVIRRN